MGYLNKSAITVDAILTNRGRELLATRGRGVGAFEIVKFALADDEIDYRLYNAAAGSNTQYGSVIENMPLLEASPDETQTMRYKLTNLTTAPFITAGGITNLGFIDLGSTSQTAVNTIAGVSTTATVNIKTRVANADYAEPYTILVSNAGLLNLYVGTVTAANLINAGVSVDTTETRTYRINTGTTPSANVALQLATKGSSDVPGLVGTKWLGSPAGTPMFITLFGENSGATATFSYRVTN